MFAHIEFVVGFAGKYQARLHGRTKSQKKTRASVGFELGPSTYYFHLFTTYYILSARNVVFYSLR